MLSVQPSSTSVTENVISAMWFHNGGAFSLKKFGNKNQDMDWKTRQLYPTAYFSGIKYKFYMILGIPSGRHDWVSSDNSTRAEPTFRNVVPICCICCRWGRSCSCFSPRHGSCTSCSWFPAPTFCCTFGSTVWTFGPTSTSTRMTSSCYRQILYWNSLRKKKKEKKMCKHLALYQNRTSIIRFSFMDKQCIIY